VNPASPGLYAETSDGFIKVGDVRAGPNGLEITLHLGPRQPGRLLLVPPAALLMLEDPTPAPTNLSERRNISTHERAGHYHRYWVGKKGSSERRLIRKWVEKTSVKGSKS